MVDKSMLVKRNRREGMYLLGPPVLRATGEIGTLEPEFSHDGLRIRHTMPQVTTLECTSSCIGCGHTFLNSQKWNALVPRVAGKEPEREQKGTSTRRTFHLCKSGIA
jgi:hypothetical protein